jgi:hypothetical protein
VDRFRVTPLADALKNKSKVGGTLLQLSTGPALSEEPPSGSIVLPAIYCSNRVRVHLVITECANRVCQPSALTECARRRRVRTAAVQESAEILKRAGGTVSSRFQWLSVTALCSGSL